jgi:hypothetical protein
MFVVTWFLKSLSYLVEISLLLIVTVDYSAAGVGIVNVPHK